MTSHPEFPQESHEEEINRLQEELFHFASQWRRTQPSSGEDAPLHLEIIEKYQEVFHQLIQLGWDWDNLAVEEMIPTALMPDVYYDTLSEEFLFHHEIMREVRWWHQKIGRPTLAIHTFDRAYTRLLDLGFNPESILPPQNSRESHVIWYGIPLSPEKYYERHPEKVRPRLSY